MQSADEIVKAIHNLPKGEQEKIRKLLESEKREKDEKLKQEIELFKKSEEWLKLNREKYIGEWVCLYGDELISHGTDGMKVHREAKEKGIKAPYLVRVVEEPENFVGAWL